MAKSSASLVISARWPWQLRRLLILTARESWWVHLLVIGENSPNLMVEGIRWRGEHGGASTGWLVSGLETTSPCGRAVGCGSSIVAPTLLTLVFIQREESATSTSGFPTHWNKTWLSYSSLQNLWLWDWISSI